MPQLQKKNTIAISNQPTLPDYAKPVEDTGGLPDYAKPVESTPAEDTGPGPLRKAFELVNKPLLDITSPAMREMTSRIGDPGLNDSVFGAQAKGFTTGAIQGIADLISSQSAPLNLGLEATGAGAVGALANDAPILSSALRVPGKVATAGMIAHGLYTGATNPDWIGKLGGLSEAAMGGAGLKHLMEGRPKINIAKEPNLPPANLPPEFTAVGAEPAYEQPRFKPTEDVQYEIARQKQKMGLDRPEITGTKSQVKKPLIKDYWITDASGKKVLNPKYQQMGINEPATFKEAGSSEPYFIKNEQGKLVANPAHPALKTEQPQAARAMGGKGLKAGSNIEGAAKELTTGYSSPVQAIMAREGIQNAVDAVKYLGKDGKISVNVDRDARTLTITDNGKGMNRNELQTVFSDLNRSGKANDPNATGGKGVGKATYLFGGEYFKLRTVKEMRGQKIQFSYEGTPDQIFKGVGIKYEVVPKDTPTGTSFTTKLTKDQDTTSTRTMIRSIIDYSRNLEAKVSYDRGFGKEGGEFRNSTNDKVIGTTNFEGTGIKLSYPKEAKLEERRYITLRVLNNGMYQYDQWHNLGEEVPFMPRDVIVDITPSAKEGTVEYPFPTQRESLKKGINKVVGDLVDEKLANPEKNKRQTKLKELYASMESLGDNKNLSRDSVMYDPGSRLTPGETEQFRKNPTIEQLSGIIDKTINDILESTGKKDWQTRLEKTGIILSPEVHGIHIPNPETGRSAILQNPFPNIENKSPKMAANEAIVTSMHEVAHIGLESGGRTDVSFTDWSHDPRIGQYLDTYFKEQKEHGNINQGHAIDFLTRLGDIYATYGPDRFFDAAEQYHNAITDQTGNYSPEVQNLLSIYKRSRGREATTEDFLSGTGERAKSSGSGEGNIRSNDKTNAGRSDREPKPEVIDKLLTALKNAGPKRAEQENLYSVERAKRIANANRVNTGGLTGFYKQLHELKGELPKVDYERTKLNPSDVNDLINEVDKSSYLLGYEKIRAKMGLLKMLTAKREEVPQFGELKLLRQVFGAKFDPIIEMHGGLGGPVAKKILLDVANAPKAIMASIDMSAPLRQGLPLIHKKEWWNSIGPMIKSFGNQEYFDAVQQSIKDRPNYLLGKEAGLKLTEMGDDPEIREEAYGSKIAGLVPGIKASERAYVGFLNKLRSDTFDSLIQDAKDAGLHPKDMMYEVADFVNTATGRGKLPGNMDRIAHELNTVFFSPRLIASRVAMMNPATYIKASPFVRKEFLKAAIATASAGLTMSGLMSALGAKTDTKLSDRKGTGLIPGTSGIPDMPISADFGKSRFGNTRIENYGGFLPYVTYIGRMLSGERESSTTGKAYVLGKGFATPTRLNVTEDFVANKLSPAAGLIYKILKQKDPTGKTYQFSPQMGQALKDISNGDIKSAMKNAKSGEVGDMFIPMFLGDLISIMKDDPKHTPLAIGSFFGMGTQTYAKNPKKSTELRIRP